MQGVNIFGKIVCSNLPEESEEYDRNNNQNN